MRAKAQGREIKEWNIPGTQYIRAEQRGQAHILAQREEIREIKGTGAYIDEDGMLW